MQANIETFMKCVKVENGITAYFLPGHSKGKISHFEISADIAV
jgi:hypothetical protein